MLRQDPGRYGVAKMVRDVVCGFQNKDRPFLAFLTFLAVLAAFVAVMIFASNGVTSLRLPWLG